MSDKGHPPAKSMADHYVAVALKIIDLASKGGHLNSPEDLRAWWQKERGHRDEYKLSDDHEAVLIKACSAKVKEMDEQQASETRQSSTRQSKRRVAI